MAGERWRLGHRPGLDGLRGIAIGLVLVQHSQIPDMWIAGEVGVCLFFVLSGFLITEQLVAEHRGDGRISLRGFYARRVRRLGPAFALALVGAGLLAVALPTVSVVTFGDVGWALSYVGNWHLVADPSPGSMGILAGTWSLAVEEQFYLLWPLVVIWAMRRGPSWLGWIAGAGIVASLVARFALADDSIRVYYGTDTNASALLTGALAAVLVHRVGRGWEAPAWVALAGLAGLLALSTLDMSAWTLAQPVTVAVAVALVMACTARRQPVILTAAWLRWLGRRSYGIYLWNCMLAALVYFVAMPWPMRVLVVVVPSLLIAELSWRCVEAPVLRRRLVVATDTTPRLRRRVVPGGADPEPVGAGVTPQRELPGPSGQH